MTSTTRLCYTITETGNKYTAVSFCGILFSSAGKQAKGEGQGLFVTMGQAPYPIYYGIGECKKRIRATGLNILKYIHAYFKISLRAENADCHSRTWCLYMGIWKLYPIFDKAAPTRENICSLPNWPPAPRAGLTDSAAPPFGYRKAANRDLCEHLLSN